MASTPKFILFCRDFKPLIGGVAEYVSNLAYYLNKNNCLNFVLTHLNQTEQLGYPVLQSKIRHARSLNNSIGDKFFLIRKFNTVIHYLALNIGAIREVIMIKRCGSGTQLIVASYYDYQTSIFLNWCCRLNLTYSIIIHGYDILTRTGNGKQNFEFHCRNAKGIIFNSNPTRKLYIDIIGSFKSSYILYPGLNVEKIELLMKHKESLEHKYQLNFKGKLVISTVSRLAKRKGIDIAIKAVSQLYKSRPDILYIICGDGEELPELIELIAELNAKEYIKLLGEVSEKEKFELLSQSKIYLLPTHNLKGNDFEGFGISFIEAEYMENVVFGGSNDGVIDAVKNNYSGFLLNFDDEDSFTRLTEKMKTVISDEQEIIKIASRAKEWVVDNFECEILTKKLIEFYSAQP